MHAEQSANKTSLVEVKSVPTNISPTLEFETNPEYSPATQMVKNSDDLMRGHSNSGTYMMSIKTPAWQRELKLHVDSLGRDKVFIRILSPAKEAGIGTLRIKNEMWNFLPQAEKTIKIPPSLMLEPWMGSDFANDDLVKESSIVNDYTHAIVGEERVAEGLLNKIELTPKPNAPVIWGKIIRWVREGDFVPFKEEYYNEKGQLVKRLEYSNFGQVSNRVMPKTWTMTNMLKEGQSTTIRLLNVTYDKPINENVFTLKHLERLP